MTGISAKGLGQKEQTASQTQGEQVFHRTCDRGILAVGQSLQLIARAPKTHQFRVLAKLSAHGSGAQRSTRAIEQELKFPD